MERNRIRRESRQRRLVLAVVQRSRKHPTAHQVFEQARREIPSISLGTVYRNLRRLAEQGLLQVSKIGNRPAHFEALRQRHYHIWCVECGRLEDLALPYQKSLDRRVQRLVRYQLQEHRMEFYGVCPRCSHQRSGSRGRSGAQRPKRRAPPQEPSKNYAARKSSKGGLLEWEMPSPG